jgi:hypothetical protein
MICVWCKTKIDSNRFRPFCDECHQNRWNEKGLKDKYCCQCALLLPKIRGKHGRPNNPSSDLCKSCMNLKQMKEELARTEKMRARGGVNNLYRGTVYKTQYSKPPRETKPKSDQRIQQQRKAARDYYEKYPERVRAGSLATYYSEHLSILYECACETNGKVKHKHHHDYSKPFEVILLCKKCHSVWHSKLRIEDKANNGNGDLSTLPLDSSTATSTGLSIEDSGTRQGDVN